ncbi:MAG TPA: FkbM family methyltransferase [Methylobacter sp.]|jgi:FkbM family methyltransferase
MEIRDFSFKGMPYKIVATNNGPQDPSWFTFVDESTVRDRDWQVKPDDVVLDIGSGYGSYALTALAIGAALIHCWNPNQEENDLLAKSAEVNGWSDKIIIHAEGVYSKTGWLQDMDQKFSTEPADGYFKVTALDDYELGLTKLDWVKLDVEGAEANVLSGAEKTLMKYKPKVQVENHQFKDSTIEGQVQNYMKSLGYKHVSTFPYHGVSHSVYEP